MASDSSSINADRSMVSTSQWRSRVICDRMKEHSMRGLVTRLLSYQDQCDSLFEEGFKDISAFPLGDSQQDVMDRFQHISDINILCERVMVEFCKELPGFDCITKGDQDTLLKGSSHALQMLWTARKYDMKTDSIFFTSNRPYTRADYQSAAMGSFTDYIFDFCRTMGSLKVDNAAYAVLKAIVFFSNRPGLREARKVQLILDFYEEVLLAYINRMTNPFSKL